MQHWSKWKSLPAQPKKFVTPNIFSSLLSSNENVIFFYFDFWHHRQILKFLKKHIRFLCSSGGTTTANLQPHVKLFGLALQTGIYPYQCFVFPLILVCTTKIDFCFSFHTFMLIVKICCLCFRNQKVIFFNHLNTTWSQHFSKFVF